MGMVNAAGCLGMLLGPAASGVIAALLRDDADPGRAPRGAFALAAVVVMGWLVASAKPIARAASRELASSRKSAG
jgi:MFS family permease